MKHETIGNRDRVWTVTLGGNGGLHAEVEAALLARLYQAASPADVADALTKIAAQEIARTRTW